MVTIEHVGSILRKTSLQFDDFTRNFPETSDKDDEEKGPLERARSLIKQSNKVIFERRLRKLKEIYMVKTYKLPEWFRNLFKDGSISVELVPTFRTDIRNSCVEFKDMTNAKLSISISPENNSLEYCRPEFCKLKITEKLRFLSVENRRDIPFKPWRQPLTFILSGNEAFSPRRVSLSGLVTEHVGYCYGKTDKYREKGGIRIVFINDTLDNNTDQPPIIGTYRRRMNTRNKYLTWKFCV